MCNYGICHMGLERIRECRSGHIYVARYENLCKVGCTTDHRQFSSIKQRLSGLRRKTKLNFKLIHVLYFSGCIKGLEFAIHKQFAEFRLGKDEIFTGADAIIDRIYHYSSFVGTDIVHISPEIQA